MADLSAMEIYQELPQTDCGDCNFPTCMAFAMQLANNQVSLDECPHVSEAAEEKLAASSAPPMKIVEIGEGEEALEIGGETVEFRHEEKFQRPTVIGIRLSDAVDEAEIGSRVEEIEELEFERVGEVISVDAVSVTNSSLPPGEFGEFVRKADEATELPLIVLSEEPEAIEKGLEAVGSGNPLIGRATEENWEEMTELADEYECPMAVEGESLEELAELTERITDEGVEDLVLLPEYSELGDGLEKFTRLRRLAIDEEFSPLGYPLMARVEDGQNPYQQVAEGASHVLKYCSVLTMDTTEPWQVLPTLATRQHIYVDPQVQSSVDSKLHEVGDPGPESPVLFTTNFQLTYYSVEGELEDAGFSAYVAVKDTGGLGILNAYADDQLSGEGIVETVREQGAMEKVDHNRLIIPGLVPQLRMSVQEESGWNVEVGPEDAASIPRYLREEW